MKHRAIDILRSVARNTFDSLPRDARIVLNGCKVHLGNLGHTDTGCKVEGLARDDGRVVVLDAETVVTHAKDEGYLETLLAHELAHCYRALCGESAAVGTEAEERGARQVTKSWGFRPPREETNG